MYGATVWITISNTGFTCLTWILSCMKQNDWKLNPQRQQQTSSLVRDRARGWRGLIFLYFGVCDIKTFRDPCPASSITEDVQQHDCFNLVRDTKEKSFFVFFFYLMEVCWLRLCTQTEQGPILTSGVYTSELSNPGSNCMFVKNKGICSLYISARSSWVFFFWSWSQQWSVFDLRKSYYKFHCASLVKKNKKKHIVSFQGIGVWGSIINTPSKLCTVHTQLRNFNKLLSLQTGMFPSPMNNALPWKDCFWQQRSVFVLGRSAGERSACSYDAQVTPQAASKETLASELSGCKNTHTSAYLWR